MSQGGNVSGWSPYVKVYDALKAGSIDGTDLVPHDNGIVRAVTANYKPPDKRNVTSDPSLTLFVGRLNYWTTERQLSENFAKYGQVKSCRLVQDIVTGMSRGYGFVEFKREKDAQRAWKQAHGSIFHDRMILVEWEFARTMPGWIPRRLGGGLGGKKESGQLRFGGRDRPFKKPLILPPDTKRPEIIHSDELCNPNMEERPHLREDSVQNAFSTISRNEVNTKEPHSTNYFGGKSREKRRHLENYSRHSYYEEGRKKYPRDSDGKYSEESYYKVNKKLERANNDKYSDQRYYEEQYDDNSKNYDRGYSNKNSYSHSKGKFLAESEEYTDRYYGHDRKYSRRHQEDYEFDCEETSSTRRSYYEKSHYSEPGERKNKKYGNDKFSGESSKTKQREINRGHEVSGGSQTKLDRKKTLFKYSYQSDEEISHRTEEKLMERYSSNKPSFIKLSPVEVSKDKQYDDKIMTPEAMNKKKRKRSESSSSPSSQLSSAKRKLKKEKKKKKRKKKHQSHSGDEESVTNSYKKKKKKKSERKWSSDEETD